MKLKVGIYLLQLDQAPSQVAAKSFCEHLMQALQARAAASL
jgi:hypothetical protein